MNTRLKKLLGGISISIIVILLNISNVAFSSGTFWFWALISLFILMFTFEDEFNAIVIMIIIGVFSLLLLAIVSAWFSGTNIPFTDRRATDQTLQVLFTITIAIATIANVWIYRKTFGMSRMSSSPDFIIDDLLYVKIFNKGNFALKGIKLTMDVKDKNKEPEEGYLKQKWKHLKDFLNRQEKRISYIPVEGESEELKEFGEYLEKKFNLNCVEEKEYCVTKSKDKTVSFIIELTLTYHSETYFKNPDPLFKRYKVTIDNKATNIKEVD